MRIPSLVALLRLCNVGPVLKSSPVTGHVAYSELATQCPEYGLTTGSYALRCNTTKWLSFYQRRSQLF